MSKEIKYGVEAQDGIIKGIDAVADIVKTTVGPRGRNILIRDQLNTPIITNDGVTIAKSIQLKDNVEDAGAALMISAANKTNNVAGDGTTTTTILAQAMIHNYYYYSGSKGADNVVQTQREMLKASDKVSDFLKAAARPVASVEDIKRVATISSGNEEIGELLANAFEQAGEFGSVIVEDSKTGKDNLMSIQGMRLTNGSVTSYLLNDRANMKSNIIEPQILITKDKIDSVTDILPILDLCVKDGRKFLFICDDIEFEPLNMILVNKAKGAPLNISIIRLPGFGELREQLLEDICIATGATLMGRDLGLTLRDFDPAYLGEASEAIISMDDTVIKFKDESSNSINLAAIRQKRANELKSQLESLPNGSDTASLKRRISNLLSGISVVQIGGNSDVEIKDKKLRIEDAINSVVAAKEEGIVPGGGYSFLLAYLANDNSKASLGEQIIYSSLTAVLKQIAENSGQSGEAVLTNCVEKRVGYNALTNQYEDLLATGVINSVKVDRYSLINATSVAATVITMGGLIIDENEKDPNVLQLQSPGLSMM